MRHLLLWIFLSTVPISLIAQPVERLTVEAAVERALAMAEVPCTYVRHPSQGGARKFEAGIQEVMRDLGLT